MAETEAINVHDMRRIMRVALKRNPHWFAHRDYVVIPPVDHFVRGFHLNRFAFRGHIRLQSVVVALYEDGINRITPDRAETFVKYAAPKTEAERIATWCEEEFSRFGWVCSPRTHLKYLQKMTGGGSTHYKMRLPVFSHAMAGDLSRARFWAATSWQEGKLDRTFHAELREEVAARGETWAFDSHYSAGWVRRMRRVLQVLRGGQEHADAMLQSFARINVRKLGLEAHWTSPWPERRWHRSPQPT